MAKIKDDKQEYQYSIPFVTPSGHEFTFYDTEDNQRLLIRHASGSHIEFKADGTVFIKSVKDIHTHGSALSKGSDVERGSEMTTLRYDADLTLDVTGRLRIVCHELDLEVGDAARCKAGTDFIISGNNVMEKATESISHEATKSIYTDTKEERKRVVTQRSEIGTQEDGSGEGGLNVINVHGNTVIKNDDPEGGITLASRGYMNFVCGQERIDLVGSYKYENLVAEQEATWTQKVKIPQNLDEQAVSRPGGDYYFMSDASAAYSYAQQRVSPQRAPYGYIEEVNNGDFISNVFIGNREDNTLQGRYTQKVEGQRIREVGQNEVVEIKGIQTVQAKRIFLN
jgi:hypothetical protein